MRLTIVAGGAALLVGCVSLQNDSYGDAFCDQMASFAMSVSKGEQKSVRLARGGLLFVDHYQTCEHRDDPEGMAFCDWLIEHGSAAFMEANINQAIACLQGQRIRGSIGNTGVISWRGEMEFWHTQLAEGVTARLNYFIPDFERRADERYLEITIGRED
jgi:hypothetical protein